MLEKIKNWFRQETEKLTPMSPKQKMEYIWMYFHWQILITTAVLFILGSLTSNYVYKSRDVLISGYFLNADTSAAGYAHLNEEYLQFSGTEDTARVELVQCRTVDFSGNGYGSETLMIVDAMVSTHSLDYMIVDETALAFLEQQGICMDLPQILSGEKLAQLSTRCTETGTIAIDLSDSSFAQTYTLYPAPTYLIVVANTPRPEKAAAFIDYLLNN